ncbi:MAG: Ig-like domain-containing protein [Lachnospiraceae bacterium]|nr:Ig-like domain-containing protein [Lachnospiraceae bacterium]MCM1236378.1 Ig-like domain-containing protein [Ruminococcus flavefaciens]
MGRKYIKIFLFALAFILLLPGMAAEAKSKPKLAAKTKALTVGQTYKLKLKGVSGKAKVKWKTSKKSVVSIAKKKGNTVTLKAKKKGTAVITATYKKKKYKCQITVKEKKKAADNPKLSSSDVALYYLSEEYKDYITYDKSHIREYRFRVSGTKKEVRDWEISGEDADYFKITEYGLLQMEWEPTYMQQCVTATVTAVLEGGRKLTARVRGYSDVNIYMDTIFAGFVQTYITSGMTEKEKAEKAAWYISATSDYELYNDKWADIFLKGKGDCMASRYAVQVLCNYMGIKALVCGDYDAHGQTLVYADGKFYLVITGYNEPKPRNYSMYEISGEALEKVAEENHIDLNYFSR